MKIKITKFEDKIDNTSQHWPNFVSKLIESLTADIVENRVRSVLNISANIKKKQPHFQLYATLTICLFMSLFILATSRMRLLDPSLLRQISFQLC